MCEVALAQCLALSRDLGKPCLFYNIIFILQTIYGLTPGVKKKKTLSSPKMNLRSLKIRNLSKNWLILLRNCFAFLWIFLGCTLGTTNVEQKMKEIKDVGENVKARKDQAFLGLPQRRAECDQTVFCIHKGVKAFTFCKGKNLLLTGGMDRIIRVWNPYLPG